MPHTPPYSKIVLLVLRVDVFSSTFRFTIVFLLVVLLLVVRSLALPHSSAATTRGRAFPGRGETKGETRGPDQCETRGETSALSLTVLNLGSS